MTVSDIFIGVIILGLFVVGIITMVLGWADWYIIGVLQNFNSGLPPNLQPSSAIDSLLSSSSAFAKFLPSLAVVFMVVLLAETWLLSAFIQSHPLAAVVGIVSLVMYTIASFILSNAAVGIARLPVFAGFIASANPLLYAFIYMPYILVAGSLIDITIGIVAARR